MENRDAVHAAGVSIGVISENLLPGMARCHLACFPEQFTSHMGLAYAEAHYRAFIKHPQGIGFAAVEQGSGRVVGLVAGGAPGIRDEFLRSAKRQFRWTLLCKFVTDRIVRGRVLSAVLAKLRLRGISAIADNPVPEHEDGSSLLLVICVASEHRGSGLAKHLLGGFENACRSRGYKRMYLGVHADNARAIACYRANGWEDVRVVGDSLHMRRNLANGTTEDGVCES